MTGKVEKLVVGILQHTLVWVLRCDEGKGLQHTLSESCVGVRM